MRYRKPPLVEAVCEFRFSSDAPWDSAMPGLIYNGLKGTFPDRTQAMALQSTVQSTPDGIRQQIIPADRIHFSRTDKKALVQVGAHYLAVNHLAPYPGWPAFRPLIDLALTQYRTVAVPRAIQRIGLRFVNAIAIAPADAKPGDIVKHEELFDFYPYLGPRLPQAVNTLLCGVTYPYADNRDTLRLQLATAFDIEHQQPTMNLDLDYFTDKPGSVQFDGVDKWLEDAHLTVEQAFEGAITDKLRERFEPEEKK